MDIRISGKNVDVTEGIKAHMEEKLLKLERYSPKIVEAHVVLEKEKYLYEAEVILLAKNLRAFGEAKSKDSFFTAIDQACSRVEKQLKKFRDKVTDHHKKDVEYVLMSNEDSSDDESGSYDAQSGERPAIVEVQPGDLKPMSLDEASLQLSLTPENFIVFLNSNGEKVNVIYKRGDGNHGLVAPLK